MCHFIRNILNPSCILKLRYKGKITIYIVRKQKQGVPLLNFSFRQTMTSSVFTFRNATIITYIRIHNVYQYTVPFARMYNTINMNKNIYSVVAESVILLQ